MTELGDCVLWLQVVVDHGLAPNASQGDLWSEERWDGFSSTFEGQGITAIRLGIKSQPAAWELSSGMQVLAAMQASMSSARRDPHNGQPEPPAGGPSGHGARLLVGRWCELY